MKASAASFKALSALAYVFFQLSGSGSTIRLAEPGCGGLTPYPPYLPGTMLIACTLLPRKVIDTPASQAATIPHPRPALPAAASKATEATRRRTPVSCRSANGGVQVTRGKKYALLFHPPEPPPITAAAAHRREAHPAPHEAIARRARCKPNVHFRRGAPHRPKRAPAYLGSDGIVRIGTGF